MGDDLLCVVKVQVEGLSGILVALEAGLVVHVANGVSLLCKVGEHLATFNHVDAGLRGQNVLFCMATVTGKRLAPVPPSRVLAKGYSSALTWRPSGRVTLYLVGNLKG